MISLIQMKTLNYPSKEIPIKMKGWNEIDERCPYCNSVIKQAKGINKQNLKKLCWTKPTMQDILILIMILFCLMLTWAYYNETSQYEFMYENPEEFCNSYWGSVPIHIEPYEIKLNISQFKKNG